MHSGLIVRLLLRTCDHACVCVVAEMSATSSLCSSTCNSLHSDDVDDLHVHIRRTSTSSSSSPRPDDHPLNLTKRKDQSSVTGTPPSSPKRDVPELSTCRDVDTAECSTPYKPASSSFSLKTSPSKFLSSPTDDQHRGRSIAASTVDGWSRVELGGKALQPAYDNNRTSMILSTSPSALDTVQLISYPLTRPN